MQGAEEIVEELPLKDAYWQVKPGQVIDPMLKKPVVGDYDLLGVAPLKSPGSNVAAVPSDLAKGDWTGPYVQKYADAANKNLGYPPRVLHGAQDQFAGNAKYMGLTDDTAYAIFPDGKVVIMNGKAEQQSFYASIGRVAADGAYPRPVAGTAVVDELAARRGSKEMSSG